MRYPIGCYLIFFHSMVPIRGSGLAECRHCKALGLRRESHEIARMEIAQMIREQNDAESWWRVYGDKL